MQLHSRGQNSKWFRLVCRNQLWNLQPIPKPAASMLCSIPSITFYGKSLFYTKDDEQSSAYDEVAAAVKRRILHWIELNVQMLLTTLPFILDLENFQIWTWFLWLGHCACPQWHFCTSPRLFGEVSVVVLWSFHAGRDAWVFNTSCTRLII